MKNMRKLENKAFYSEGKPLFGSTQRVSITPLFFGARGKENEIEEQAIWKTHRICLRHGEKFQWKNRCARCHYLIRFQAGRVG